MKKREKTNLLYLVIRPNGEEHYFTSRTKAGEFIGANASSIDYAIVHGNKSMGCDIKLVDGSEIKWKDINNL